MRKKIVLVLLAACMLTGCGQKQTPKEPTRFEMSMGKETIKLPTTLDELKEAGWNSLYDVADVESKQTTICRLTKDKQLIDAILVNDTQETKAAKDCKAGLFVINYNENNNPNFKLYNGLKMNRTTKAEDVKEAFGKPTQEVDGTEGLTLFYSKDADTSYTFDFVEDKLAYVRIENLTEEKKEQKTEDKKDQKTDDKTDQKTDDKKDQKIDDQKPMPEESKNTTEPQ